MVANYIITSMPMSLLTRLRFYWFLSLTIDFAFHYRHRFPASRRRNGLRDSRHQQRHPDRVRTVPVHDAPGLPVQFVEGVFATSEAAEEPARGLMVTCDQNSHRPGQQTGLWRGVWTGRPEAGCVGKERGRDICGRHQQSSIAYALGWGFVVIS